MINSFTLQLGKEDMKGEKCIHFTFTKAMESWERIFSDHAYVIILYNNS
jgi:hypothetical protein